MPSRSCDTVSLSEDFKCLTKMAIIFQMMRKRLSLKSLISIWRQNRERAIKVGWPTVKVRSI